MKGIYGVVVSVTVALCSVSSAGCKQRVQTGAQAAQSTVTDADSASDALEQGASDAQGSTRVRPRAPSGAFPGDQAILVIRESPAMIVVQRRDRAGFERLTSMECTSNELGEGTPDVTRCEWRSAHCHGTTQSNGGPVIGASPRLEVTATANTPADEATCSAFAGTYFFPFNMVRGPRGPSFPDVPGRECLLDQWTFSVDQNACAASNGEEPVKSYLGACCVGRVVTQFASTAPARLRWVSNDGRTLATATDSETLSLEAQRSNAVFLRVFHGSSARDLRINDVFAGDPVLSGATSFSFDVSLLNDSVQVRSIGGAAHSIALAR
ncbi:MAG: hypothetical protein U0269_16835 [Polyangiales bacterium]